MKNNITTQELNKLTRNTDKLLLKMLSADLKEFRAKQEKVETANRQKAA